MAEGYDRIAHKYAQWTADVVDEVRPRYTAVLADSLPRGASLLDLGCGGGGPTTRQLAERFRVTGVDISGRQIELARQNVPQATFIHADMTRVAFPPSSFDGVAAFYTLNHLPHDELPPLLAKIGTWLRPGGTLVATMTAGANPGTVEPEWLGVPMYFSGYPAQENQRFIREAGLEIASARIETIVEDGRPVPFLWVIAKNPAATA